MKHAINCKFCRKPMTLTVDDAYSELGDPLKLIHLAACNPCADLRVRHRQETDSIAKACYKLIELRQKKNTSDAQSTIRDSLITATKRYAESTAMINACKTMIWSPDMAAALFDKPEQFGQFLANYQKDLRTNPPA